MKHPRVDWDLDYELTVKEIDRHTEYGVLELAGMTGLSIDKVEYLMQNRIIPSHVGRIKGEDFLNWVDQAGLPVRGDFEL